MFHQTETVPVGDLWGVGWYPTTSPELAPYSATHAEMERHRKIASRRLSCLGVGRDDIVVYVARSQEAVQFTPWEEAANELGAAFCVVDGFSMEAHRLVAYVRQFRPKAVLGLMTDVVTGLVDRGEDPGHLLRDVPVLAARPEVCRLLRQWDVECLQWLHLGPAVAVECRARQGAHVAVEWSAFVKDGEIAVHSSPDQRLPAVIDTGWRGRVERETCACGSEDPRIFAEARLVPTA